MATRYVHYLRGFVVSDTDIVIDLLCLLTGWVLVVNLYKFFTTIITPIEIK